MGYLEESIDARFGRRNPHSIASYDLPSENQCVLFLTFPLVIYPFMNLIYHILF